MSSIVKVDTIQENTSANGITVDGLNIKDSKLVTANSVVASNITADAIDATKIADNAISEEHLDVTAITGHTAETSIADGDTILIHDASASALRKMTRANFVSGIGGTNTPNFFAYVSSNFNISSDTETILAFNAELYDTASAFNTSNYTFTVPSGQAGKYFLFGQTRKNNFSGTRTFIQIFKTPSGGSAADIFIAENSGGSDGYITIGGSAVANLSVGDALQVRVYHNDSGSRGFFGDATNTFFGGYKLIE